MQLKIIKMVLENLSSPVGLVSLFFGFGLALSLRGTHRELAKRLLFAGVCLYFCMFCTPLGDLPMSHLEHQFPLLKDTDLSKDARAIVVLSSFGVNSPETPITRDLSEETICRLVEGIRLYRLIPKSTLIVSGGIVREGDPPIGQLMASFLVSMGLPQNDISIEGQSQDTYENIRNVRTLVGDKPFYLVTSGYHLRRAMAVANRFGLKAIPSPAFIRTMQGSPEGIPILKRLVLKVKDLGVPSEPRVSDLQRAYHEYVGYLW
ncbi:MAG TPA: YdcF family protein, partial [Candidatus Hodarchaeales archaeon]|nr:YdcF family protein [Candidatus Hodarchaeales archaeon]